MKEKDMKSQREPARQILSPRALQKPERKSAVLRDHLQICICEDKVLPWSQCVTKGLLPVVEGGCKVLHVPKLVDFREPKRPPRRVHRLPAQRNTCLGCISQLDGEGGLVFFNGPLREVQQACNGIISLIDTGQMFDSASHLLPEWFNFRAAFQYFLTRQLLILISEF